MAAQAVDFSVSGRVSRALVITDSDDSTSAAVGDWGSSGSRIRASGSNEMMDGMTVGGNLEYAAGDSLKLRYAEVYYSGAFGKISIGQGDEGGEGSVYSDKSGVSGIGHGQEKGSIPTTRRAYFGSLDGGGGRNERIRYDTPAIGPVSAAISVGNDDEVSAGVKISQSFGDTAFGAKLGVSRVAGATNDDGSPADDTDTISASAGIKLPAGITVSGAWGTMDIEGAASDPSFFQATVGYVMGDTSVGVSWYASTDFTNDGSEGTAIGIGATHNLPKVNASVTAAVQNYSVEDGTMVDSDETVAMLATVISSSRSRLRHSYDPLPPRGGSSLFLRQFPYCLRIGRSSPAGLPVSARPDSVPHPGFAPRFGTPHPRCIPTNRASARTAFSRSRTDVASATAAIGCARSVSGPP